MFGFDEDDYMNADGNAVLRAVKAMLSESVGGVTKTAGQKSS